MKRTEKPSQTSTPAYRWLLLALICPLALFGCASNPVGVCPPAKPMPEAVQQVKPVDRLQLMCQILGENCDGSAPIF